jgi:hydrogenase/urease accessory protein HupE
VNRGFGYAACLAICLAAASSALAHSGGSTGYASITVRDSTVRYSLTLSPSTLPPGIAEDLVRARAGREQSRDRLLGYMKEKIHISDQGRRCQPARDFMIGPRSDVESVTLVVDFACVGAVRRLAIRDDMFDVIGQDHHTLAAVESSAGVQQLAFEPGARDAQVAIAAEAPEGPHGVGFFRLGVEHILTGYDHLLFLLALLLRGGRLWSLLKIVTAFTIAHSITLALAVLGVVAIPERLVEAVIAASIVWVAIENLALRDAPSRRWLVSFVFGLVHGFGFASALEPLSLPPGPLVLALFGFNIGVEAGQAMIVVLLLPLLTWSRGKQWEPGLVRTASLGVAVMGFAWLIERVFA